MERGAGDDASSISSSDRDSAQSSARLEEAPELRLEDEDMINEASSDINRYVYATRYVPPVVIPAVTRDAALEDAENHLRGAARRDTTAPIAKIPRRSAGKGTKVLISLKRMKMKDVSFVRGQLRAYREIKSMLDRKELAHGQSADLPATADTVPRDVEAVEPRRIAKYSQLVKEINRIDRVIENSAREWNQLANEVDQRLAALGQNIRHPTPGDNPEVARSNRPKQTTKAEERQENYTLNNDNQTLRGRAAALNHALAQLHINAPALPEAVREPEPAQPSVPGNTGNQQKCRAEWDALWEMNIALETQNTELQLICDDRVQRIETVLSALEDDMAIGDQGHDSDDGGPEGEQSQHSGAGHYLGVGLYGHRGSTGVGSYDAGFIEADALLDAAIAWLRAIEVGPSDTQPEQALVDAYRRSLAVTADIPGDIPTLLRHVYFRHVGGVMPSVQQPEVIKATPADLEELSALLNGIPPLKPTAQALLDRVRTILTEGLPLSMNVELVEGQDLPVALHTLLQGTLWAIMMQGGANPDLTDESRNSMLYGYEDTDKALWFLCKKFFFTHQVAEKDGEVVFNSGGDGIFASDCHRLYAGRVFEVMVGFGDGKYELIRVPPIVRIFGMGTIGLIMLTPRGVYSFHRARETLVDERHPTDRAEWPVRVAFRHCPRVAEYEASLPVWHKHELVFDVGLTRSTCVLLTPAGAVSLGNEWLVEQDYSLEEICMFRPMPLPNDFIPTRVTMTGTGAILSTGDRQMIGGDIATLGRRLPRGTFTDLHFRVDSASGNSHFTLLNSGSEVLFVGRSTPAVHASVLLPSSIGRNDICADPTPLRFPEGTTSYHIDPFFVVITHSGFTDMYKESSVDGDWSVLTRTVEAGPSAVSMPMQPSIPHIYLITGSDWLRVDLMDTDKTPQSMRDTRGQVYPMVPALLSEEGSVNSGEELVDVQDTPIAQIDPATMEALQRVVEFVSDSTQDPMLSVTASNPDIAVTIDNLGDLTVTPVDAEVSGMIAQLSPLLATHDIQEQQASMTPMTELEATLRGQPESVAPRFTVSLTTPQVTVELRFVQQEDGARPWPSSGADTQLFTMNGRPTLWRSGLDSFWVITTFKEPHTATGSTELRVHDDLVLCVAILPNNTLVTGSGDRTLVLWDPSGRVTDSVRHTEEVLSLAASPDGTSIALGGERTIQLWSPTEGITGVLTGHRYGVCALAFSHDGRTLYSGANDNSVKVWDVAAAECVRTMEGHTDFVRSIALSPDGRLLASGSADKTIRVTDTETGAIMKTLDLQHEVFSVAFSPDGTLLASGTSDTSVALWQTETWSMRELPGHRSFITYVAFDPDGTLASASDDRTVKLWDVEIGQCLETLEGHSERVTCLAFSADGSRLLSGAADTTARLWTLQERELV
ncbi:WD domain, G-beta repeat [Carpediemonas membranifera]|uniref:WD domain, G-beta repeat n=1 Tax=Carpediemonas membranifera TaxID=201153 RepID=A0A8J6E9A0_9EUKA|nr:WD domain, G-beta repeat [Carpediemonas membranifera]|eukprot:KAG9393025.1 WD domain, G-beta repeat [Carpediemonas membranifera]